LDYLTNSYKPITDAAWVRARICKLQKSDKVYQLLAHGRWFPPDTPASSTTKTDRHDIAEILFVFFIVDFVFNTFIIIM
jgi:hypothetical protein